MTDDPFPLPPSLRPVAVEWPPGSGRTVTLQAQDRIEARDYLLFLRRRDAPPHRPGCPGAADQYDQLSLDTTFCERCREINVWHVMMEAIQAGATTIDPRILDAPDDGFYEERNPDPKLFDDRLEVPEPPVEITGPPERLVLGDPLYEITFGGATYDGPRDKERLFAQLRRVAEVMADGDWHTLEDIAKRTGDPEASVSARLRDFRKPRWGARVVEREHVSQGLWRYRVQGAVRSQD